MRLSGYSLEYNRYVVKTFPKFVNLKKLLSWLQKPATATYPEPDPAVHTITCKFLKKCFNIAFNYLFPSGCRRRHYADGWLSQVTRGLRPTTSFPHYWTR
jgi:hypothetical protein